MNETTRTLLLKTRKGATAAFETKQWNEVLTALGFTVVIEKTRNTVTKVTVHAPNRNTLVIEKEPNYRRIVWYDLGRWIKSDAVKMDLVELASKALGLDTPDVEKKLKDLYVRDLTNTGTCAVCEGNYKREGTGIGHHGFRRPGDGMLHGSCFAVGYLPFELSPIGAEAYLADALRPTLARQEKWLAELPSKTSFLKMPSSFEKRRNPNVLPETITKETNAYEFESMMKSAIYQAERTISMLKSDIEHFEKKVATWAPDELPEIKYAGKFKAA